MKLGAALKFLVCLAGVVQSPTLVHGSMNRNMNAEIDVRVQSAATEVFSHVTSIDDFAAHQHQLDFWSGHFIKEEEGFVWPDGTQLWPGHFIKKGGSFAWFNGIRAENPKNSLLCNNTVYLTHWLTEDPLSVELVSESEEPRLKAHDCGSLRSEIISAHARLALQGKLSKENPYNSHYAYRCNGEDCESIGNLSQISNVFSEEQRKDLAKLPMEACRHIGLKETEHSKGLKHSISASLFFLGRVPGAISDICVKLWGHFQ